MSKILTNKEKETLNLLEELTIKQLANRRGCSVQAVYKILKNIEKKGVEKKGLKSGRTSVLSDNFKPFPDGYVRLHGMQFSIKIIMQKSFYRQVRDRGDWIKVDGHTIRLNKRSLDVYQSPDDSFFGEDENVVTEVAFDYWDRFFLKLEHRYKLLLVKDQHSSIRLVKHHYARIQDGIARKCNEENKKINIYSEDGKLRFTIDASLKGDEAETQHVDTAKGDMGSYKKQINDWLVYNPPTNSELSSHIAALTSNMEYFGVNMVSHVEAIQTLHRGVGELTGVVSSLKNVVVSKLPSILELCDSCDWVFEVFSSLSNSEKLREGFGIR